MSIRLCIQTEDQEVEDLLVFMRARFPKSDASEHVAIMNRAEKWLRTLDEYLFIVNLHAGDEASLDCVRTDLTVIIYLVKRDAGEMLGYIGRVISSPDSSCFSPSANRFRAAASLPLKR